MHVILTRKCYFVDQKSIFDYYPFDQKFGVPKDHTKSDKCFISMKITIAMVLNVFQLLFLALVYG